MFMLNIWKHLGDQVESDYNMESQVQDQLVTEYSSHCTTQCIEPFITTLPSSQYDLINVNPSPAEPRYVLPLQTVYIQISWLLQKPTDLDLHCH